MNVSMLHRIITDYQVKPPYYFEVGDKVNAWMFRNGKTEEYPGTVLFDECDKNEMDKILREKIVLKKVEK